MKNKLSLVIVFVLLISLFLPCASSAATAKVYVNGVKVESSAVKGKGGTYLEAAPVLKALGYTYAESVLSGTERMLTFEKNTNTYSTKTGSLELVTNGKKTKLKSPFILVGNFVYIPTNFFALINTNYVAKSGAHLVGFQIKLADGAKFVKYGKDGLSIDYPSNWKLSTLDNSTLLSGGSTTSEKMTVDKVVLPVPATSIEKELKAAIKEFITDTFGKGSFKDCKFGSVKGLYSEYKIGGAFVRIYGFYRDQKCFIVTFACPSKGKADFITMIDYMMTTLSIA